MPIIPPTTQHSVIHAVLSKFGQPLKKNVFKNGKTDGKLADNPFLVVCPFRTQRAGLHFKAIKVESHYPVSH